MKKTLKLLRELRAQVRDKINWCGDDVSDYCDGCVNEGICKRFAETEKLIKEWK